MRQKMGFTTRELPSKSPFVLSKSLDLKAFLEVFRPFGRQFGRFESWFLNTATIRKELEVVRKQLLSFIKLEGDLQSARHI